MIVWTTLTDRVGDVVSSWLRERTVMAEDVSPRAMTGPPMAGEHVQAPAAVPVPVPAVR